MDLTALARSLKYQNGCGERSKHPLRGRRAASPVRDRLWRRVLLAAVLLLGMSMQSAIAQEIWFGPNSQYPELTDLFKPGAHWTAAASHVKAFEMVGSLSAPEDALIQIFSNLRSCHMDLVIGLPGLTAGGPGHCGFGVEGNAAPDEVDVVVHRIKALGAEPQHFSLDEPLYFGHDFVRSGDHFGCRASIVDVARDVATKVKQIHAVFPNADIGDVEPIFALTDAEIEEWLDDYEASTGTKLSFMRFDMDWNSSWRTQIPPIARLLRRKGVAMQVIYNGSGFDQSDQRWMAHAVANFKAFETSITPPPAVVVIQSWDPYPRHLLPESNPLTLTGLVDQYVAWRQSRR